MCRAVAHHCPSDGTTTRVPDVKGVAPAYQALSSFDKRARGTGTTLNKHKNSSVVESKPLQSFHFLVLYPLLRLSYTDDISDQIYIPERSTLRDE